MNGINRTCSLSVGLITSCLMFAATSYADEPDIATLKQAIPILSPENEALNSFYFIGESVLPLGVPVTIEVCWSRDSGFGFVQVDHLGYPVFFIAEKKSLLYDALESQVMLGEDAFPNLTIQSQNRKLSWMSGFHNDSDKKARFVVDLPSIVSTAKTEPDISRVNKTDWKLTYKFDKGAEVSYVFHVDRDISFKSALLKSRQQPILTIRNILINQPVPDRLMKFPETKSLSSAVTVKDLGEGLETNGKGLPVTRLGEAIGKISEDTLFLVRAQLTSAAIYHDSYRKYPLPSDIDWKQVEKKHKRIGTKLKSLLNVDIKGRVIKANKIAEVSNELKSKK